MHYLLLLVGGLLSVAAVLTLGTTGVIVAFLIGIVQNLALAPTLSPVTKARTVITQNTFLSGFAVLAGGCLGTFEFALQPAQQNELLALVGKAPAFSEFLGRVSGCWTGVTPIPCTRDVWSISLTSLTLVLAISILAFALTGGLTLYRFRKVTYSSYYSGVTPRLRTVHYLFGVLFALPAGVFLLYIFLWPPDLSEGVEEITRRKERRRELLTFLYFFAAYLQLTLAMIAVYGPILGTARRRADAFLAEHREARAAHRY
ncbi:MAG: hypothetical protein AAF416_12535 [Pseudomonadota bacterium]